MALEKYYNRFLIGVGRGGQGGGGGGGRPPII